MMDKFLKQAEPLLCSGSETIKSTSMKKMMLLLIVLLGSVAYAGAQVNEATAVLEDKCQIKTSGSLSYVEMNLNASAEMVDHMKQEAAKYVNYFVFEVINTKANEWRCKMGFTTPSFPESFHKMFLALSISHLTWKGNTYGIEKLVEILKTNATNE